MKHNINLNIFSTICCIIYILSFILLPNNNLTFDLRKYSKEDFSRNLKHYSNEILKDTNYKNDEIIIKKRLNLSKGNNINVALDLDFEKKHSNKAVALSLTCDKVISRASNEIFSKDNIILNLSYGKNIINENLRYRGRNLKKCRFLLTSFKPTKIKINNITLKQQYEIPYYVINLIISLLLSLILTRAYFLIFSKSNKQTCSENDKISGKNVFFSKDISNHSLLIIIGFLFLLSFIIRFNFANFYKILGTYIDEARYYYLANSFTRDDGFTLYNAKYFNSKIFYPFLISSAFFFANYILRMKVIALINTALLTLGVFPVYLLAKNLIKSNKACLLLCIIYLLMADQCYSMVIFSEVAYIPFSILCFYFFYLLLNHKVVNNRPLFSFFVGTYIYFLYLCKEIGVIFLVAYFLYIFIEFIFSIVCKSKKSFLQDKKEFYLNLKSFIFVLLGFLPLFFLLKFTIFNDMPITYQKMDYSIIFTRFSFTIYAYVTFCFNFLSSYFFIPVLIPIMFFKYLPNEHKKTLLYLLIVTLCLSVVATCMVTVRDEFRSVIPRNFSRYYSHLTIPFLIFFVSIIELKTRIKFNILHYIIVFSLIISFCLFFNGSYDGDISDDVTLRYIHLASYESLVIFKIASVFLFLYFFIVFEQHKIQIATVFFLMFILTQLYNNVDFIRDIYQARYIGYSQVDMYGNLERDVKEKASKNYLVLVPGWWNCSIQKIDTFLPYKNVYWTNLYDVLNMKKRKIALNNYYSFFTNQKYNFKNIDYIFLGNNYYISEDQGRVVDSFKDEYLVLYQIMNPKKIPNITMR